MNNSHNALIIVDDDAEDPEIFQEIYAEIDCENPLVMLHSGEEVMAFLESNPPPFFILCDYYMPRVTGIEVRKRLLSDPENRYKSTPFVHWSGSIEATHLKGGL